MHRKVLPFIRHTPLLFILNGTPTHQLMCMDHAVRCGMILHVSRTQGSPLKWKGCPACDAKCVHSIAWCKWCPSHIRLARITIVYTYVAVERNLNLLCYIPLRFLLGIIETALVFLCLQNEVVKTFNSAKKSPSHMKPTKVKSLQSTSEVLLVRGTGTLHARNMSSVY